ncbi:MAG TPA: amino acid adenylation domain-containing protein, partial [Thermoanaerobaculia bacterium]|nr:amino acid adenylation domain-containing protein [Thermoanaerobaculia bacterium]
QTLWELPLLDEAERRQTLVDWNRTASAFPRESAIHELFEEQVERAGGAVALEFEEQSLTYAELNARANQVAHRLRRLGVVPESLVVLAVPRSVEMIVGMLGILKAGGAYLPLDPGQPAERLALLVEESRPTALVTLEAHLEALPDFGSRAICLDRDQRDLEREPAENPRSGVTADNLVYVLYTSGSTAKPKAVAVPHRGLVRLVRGADYARLDAEETFFQFAPLSFDPSTLEIFGALANGGRLAVAPPGAYSLTELGRVIRRHGVTTLWLTSGLFHQMIEEGLDDLRGVRQLMSGGDVLSPPHIRRALAALSGVEIIDGYGPTENSCFTTCYRVDPQDPPAVSVPIGRPVANTTVYILDGELRPVPVGVPGELCTGGDGLARGYMARPELTAERFIPSPLAGDGDEPGARLYRTGDLARWRPDGNIDFLGRMDSQVKIRGYRIEPGEVEAVLAEHPSLAECAVVVRREDTGERRLVAWYIPSSPVAPADLKEHLGARLPAYMVPSAFVEIGAMPLTVSGKVDRRVLARLEAPAGDGPSELYAEPRTAVEKQIAAIWRDLLRREQVGLHDDFFDLGGHSLLATRVLSRLRESLRVDLPLTVLFEKSTLFALAATVEEVLGAGSGAGAGRQEDVPAGPALPLSYSQERLWFLEQLQPGTSAYNIPYGVRLRGAMDPGAFAGALREIARRHQILRITLGESLGEPIQRVSPSLDLALPLVDLSALPEEVRESERERLTIEEARRPFDLVRGPVLRAQLLRLGHEDHVIVVTIHHISTDGWSTAIFLRELVTFHQAAVEGRPSPLPELPRQYFDFARWQREQLRGERLAGLLAYWRQALSGTPEVLELPADRPRPPVRSFRGASVHFEWDETLSRRLRNLAREGRGTLFMVLLAGLDTLLSRYSRQTDLSVGSVIANRNRAEWESLIGFFVNSLVMRVRWDGDPSFGDLLGRVRNATLGAYEHQDLPFEKVVEDLQPERSLAHSPLFQVMFALQNNESASGEIPGLLVEPYDIGAVTAKFDLTFLISERDGRVGGTLEYATDLFDEPTVARLVEHFRNLLAAAAAEPRT